jgi:biotin operon repressor
MLTGLQKKITDTIYDLCKISSDRNSCQVSIEILSTQCGSTTSAVKKAIQRLEQKGILTRKGFKNGRGGWSMYSIKDDIHQEMLNIETRAKLEPKWSQSGAKVGTEVEPTVSSSSSINIKTTTKLLAGWEAVSMDRLLGYDFLSTTVRQLSEFKLVESPDSAQRSINNFAEFLRTSRKQLKSPASYFMRIMRDTGKFECTAPSRPIEVPKRVETEEERWATLNRYKQKT